MAVSVGAFGLGLVLVYSKIKRPSPPISTKYSATSPLVNYYEPTSGQVGTKTFTLTIVRNVISGGPKTITVRQGDAIELIIKGGIPQGEADISIDGYNLKTALDQNGSPVLEFKASRKGAFPIKLVPEHEEDEPNAQSSIATIGTFIVQ